MGKLRVLDLFSGIGGFSLGLERTGGFETVAFCEIEEYPRKVLAKHWPDVPIAEDVRELRGDDIGSADVICGGYPCQPFSLAGKRQGEEDDRHLWPEVNRLLAELRPTWFIGENVAGHISMGLDDVLADLEAEGYACRTFVIPACAIGASHRRDRVWTVAHATHMQRNGGKHYAKAGAGQFPEPRAGSGADYVAHAVRSRRPRQGQPFNTSNQAAGGSGEADEFFNGGKRGERRIEPGLGGMADGFSCRLDEPGERVKAGVKDRAARLKALGNAVHPDIPLMIGRAILAAEAAQ